MQCASVGDGGQLVVAGEAPCQAHEFVLLTPGEHQASLASPFKLTLAEGATLSAAILSVWVAAWAVKAAARALSSGDPEQT